LIANNGDLRTVVASTSRGLTGFSRQAKSSLTYWQIRADGRFGLDLNDVLNRAYEFGLRSILVEGGSSLATSFLKARLVDKVMLFVAPRILGKGIQSVGDLGMQSVAESLQLVNVDVTTIGGDILVTGYPGEVA
jgi:riboflavin biosynthesis pyrimidine reductase